MKKKIRKARSVVNAKIGTKDRWAKDEIELVEARPFVSINDKQDLNPELRKELIDSLRKINELEEEIVSHLPPKKIRNEKNSSPKDIISSVAKEKERISKLFPKEKEPPNQVSNVVSQEPRVNKWKKTIASGVVRMFILGKNIMDGM